MTIPAELRAQILGLVDRFVADRVAPQARRIDETEEFPRDLWNEAAEIGLFALGIPEQFGGIGRDTLTALLITERLARASAAFALTFNNTSDAIISLVEAGSDQCKAKYLPSLASGALIPCVSISEPQGGSDVAAIRTRAERRGDDYVLNGRKMWCTNGSVGDVFMIFAKTDPAAGSRGLSGFVVERDTPGFAVGRTEPLIGLRGSPVTELILEDVTVSPDALLGEEGGGFRLAMLTLNESRLQCGATALGVAAAALDHAIGYARERVQFDRPIIEHQGLQFLLAELATELAAARALWGASARQLVKENTRRTAIQCAMTKLFCADVCMKITTEAVQVFGANGLSREFPVERLMRDAKAFQIYDGTTQIQKGIIGRELGRSGSPFGFLPSDDLSAMEAT